MNRVLLNNVDHHDLRVITRHGAEFGDAVNQVMVFPTEFESVQREYPIVFRRDAEGALRPVALLGLARDENLFLDGAGEWQAGYVPALLQRGPFSVAAPDAADGEPMIRVDLADPRVSRSEGTPVFLPHGGNSPYLEQMTDVLRTLYVGHQRNPSGTSIYDVADPRNPKLLSTIDVPAGWHSSARGGTSVVVAVENRYRRMRPGLSSSLNDAMSPLTRGNERPAYPTGGGPNVTIGVVSVPASVNANPLNRKTVATVDPPAVSRAS